MNGVNVFILVFSVIDITLTQTLVEFTEGAKLELKPLRISGCSYRFNGTLGPTDVYLTLNGTRLNLTSYDAPAKRKRRSYENTGIFTPVLIPGYNYTGYYRCEAYNKDNVTMPFTSNVSFIQMPEYSVKFLNSPQVRHMKMVNNLYGIEISGCTYDSPYNLNDHAYIKVYNNRKELLKIIKVPYNSWNPGDINHTIPNYYVYSYDEAGKYYACAIIDPKRMKNMQITNLIETNITHPYIYQQPTYNTSCRVWSMLPKGFVAYWMNDGLFHKKANVTYSITDSRILTFSNLTRFNDTGNFSCFFGIRSHGVVSKQVQFSEIYANFVSNPFFEVTDSSIILKGCIYETNAIDLTTYWVRITDGVKIPSITTTTKSFTNLSIDSWEKISSYKCVLEHPLLPQTVSSDAASLDGLDFYPEFVADTKPFNTSQIKLNNPLNIRGCKIRSKVNINTTMVNKYFLMNGFEKKLAELIQESSKVYEFQRSVEKSTYNDHGFYQCLLEFYDPIKKKDVLLLTEGLLNIQFPEIYTTSVEFRVEGKVWHDDYKNAPSLKYSELSEQVVNNMKKNLKMAKNSIFRVLGFSKGSVIAKAQILLENITKDEKLKQCNLIDDIREQMKNYQNLIVKSLDCCTRNKTGEEDFKGIYEYNNTLVGETVFKKCEYALTPSVQSSRLCQSNMKFGPEWSKIVLDDCPAKTLLTNQLILLTRTPICSSSQSDDHSCISAFSASENLTNILNSAENITIKQDIGFISTIVKNIVNTTFQVNTTQETVRNITENIVETVNVVIASNRSILTRSQKDSRAPASLLESLDNFAVGLGEFVKDKGINKTISVSKNNTAFTLRYIEPDFIDVVALQEQSGKVSIDSKTGVSVVNARENEIALSFGRIPKEAFKNKPNTIYSFFFRNDALFQSTQEIKGEGQPRLFGNVLALTVGKEKVVNLTNPVEIKFKRSNNYRRKESYNIICKFWSPGQYGLHGGNWNGSGCEKTVENNTWVICKCNHLTNFAVLMDVSQTNHSTLELEIFTWIGCGISLAGLLLTALTHLVFPKLRQKLPQKILLCLVFSLMALLIVFLGCVDATYIKSRLGCQIVSGIIHYFILSTFLWMMIEGINLYRKFVKIFHSGSDEKFLKLSLFVAWGLPLVIVIVTGAIKPEDLGNKKFCVVTGYSFYFAVLFPICAVLLFNFIVLVMVMRSLNSPSSFVAKKKEIKGQARIAFACSLLLGLTWVFAIFAVGELRDAFQWLFTIFNSLQGLFIFIFYTVNNKDVRKELQRCHSGKNNRDSSIGESKSQSVEDRIGTNNRTSDEMISLKEMNSLAS